MVCVGCRYVNVGQSGTRIAVAQRCRTTMGLRLLGLAGARDQAKNDQSGSGQGSSSPSSQVSSFLFSSEPQDLKSALSLALMVSHRCRL